MSRGTTDEQRPKRKGGPLATNRRRHVAVPLRLASRRELDEWRRQQDDRSGRKEAIRRLVVMALENGEA
jgi:hypothetical protein